MQVYYNEVDITDEVEIASVIIEDDCGETLDSLKVVFNDTGKLWSQFFPKQNDVLEVRQEGYSTGRMYMDSVNPNDSTMVLQALPVKASAKTKKSGGWEWTTLPLLGKQKARENGLVFSAMGIEPIVFPRVDQQCISDLAFIANRCALQGAFMKLHQDKMTIYSEDILTKSLPVKTLKAEDMISRSFRQSAKGCCQAYTLCYGGLSVTATDNRMIDGKSEMRSDVAFFSLGEGQGYAQSLLQRQNQNHVAGSFETTLTMSLAAGNVLAITGMGMFDGSYFISHVTHMPVEQVSLFEVRRLGG